MVGQAAVAMDPQACPRAEHPLVVQAAQDFVRPKKIKICGVAKCKASNPKGSPVVRQKFPSIPEVDRPLGTKASSEADSLPIWTERGVHLDLNNQNLLLMMESWNAVVKQTQDLS